MRHIFGFSRHARRHFENTREGGPDAPYSRKCARSGSTGREGERGGRDRVARRSDSEISPHIRGKSLQKVINPKSALTARSARSDAI